MLGFFYWDPQPEMFQFDLPFLHRGILWYGFFFALGFFCAYCAFLYCVRLYLAKTTPASVKSHSLQIADKATLYVVIGTLIGARLGDVLFYQDWGEIARHPIAIIKIWEGGLASHGAAVGIFIALWLLSKKISLPFLRLLDLIVAPTALAGMFIRIGNFFGQEILGIPTQMPWGVVFGHPVDGLAGVPRHPVQLYEAFWYGLVFLVLLTLVKRHPNLKRQGRIAGLFFLLVFSFRFLIEFLKVEQSSLLQNAHLLTMGQWLSLPAIALGVFLLMRAAHSGSR
ncbi:MAG TPA: prolipoprotein diacylglyceryl transferase [Rhabdochlamydiaceae bacterium]|jgi:prolipoprotein diacylglyceryl transferase